ncbi:MAG TPA: hypothetical protein VGM78_09500 [Ilumatobacteraceae bacterium]
MISIDLYLDVEQEWVLARTVLERDLPIRTDVSSLSLKIDGTEYLLGQWNLGRVDLLTDEIEDCAARLRAAGPGIVRSAIFDRHGVPYHLFDPPAHDGAEAHVSRFFINDDEASGWFPLTGWGLQDPAQLFEWVERHRSELLTAEEAIRRREMPMVRVPAPVDQLLEELDAVVALGRDVVRRAPEPEDDDE